mmetsp:Transcript_13819/g.21652  ORF Transcript_13819/g.21652 Transcript_13819/m.21652 type:complete len:661 (-) Transcript_13819:58-2040(-)
MFKRSVSLLGYRSAPSLTGLTRRQHRVFSNYQVTGGYGKVSASPWDMYYPRFEVGINFKKKTTQEDSRPITHSHAGDREQRARAAAYQESEQQIKEYGYDMIVDCDRLLDLNANGWPIHLKVENALWYGIDDKGHKRMMPEKESRVKTVAVSGIFNTGKTFFVNNLCRFTLPSDDGVSTKGLSIKHLDDTEILIMDTAGSNSAIEVTGELSLSDKISSEKILQNTIYDVANFHVCVVNKLTWPDQHHFEMIYDKIKESQSENGKACTQQMPLYIVHNFRDHSLQDLKGKLLGEIKRAYKQGRFRCDSFMAQDEEEEFRNLIDEFIESDDSSQASTVHETIEKLAATLHADIQNEYRNAGLFAGDSFIDAAKLQGTLSRLLEMEARKQQSEEFNQAKVEALREKLAQRPSFWFDSKGDNTTKHMFLVDNSASAGAQAYNFFVFEQMRRELQTSPVNKENPFSLSKVFDSLSQNINQYVKFVDVKGNIIQVPQPLQPHICFVGNNDNPDFRLILDPELAEQEANIKLKKSSELEYNALFIGATSWKPRYDVHYNEETGICTVWLELPGKSTAKVSVVPATHNDDGSMLTTLKIKGVRDRDEDYPNEFGPNDKMDRNFGEFNFEIKLKKEYTRRLGRSERKHGVLTIKIAKEEQQDEEDVVDT